MWSIFTKCAILLILFNQCLCYDRECKARNTGKFPTVTFLTNDVHTRLSDVCCDYFTRVANIQMIQTKPNAVKDQTYCNELNDILLKSSAHDVVVLSLETPDAVPPCNYRVHTKSPVLLQVTNSSRHTTYDASQHQHYFELWVDSRFGQVREGPLRFIEDCMNSDIGTEKAAFDELANSFNLAIHLSKQSEDAMIDDLYPRLKIMSDEALYDAWAKYRDKMDRESKDPMSVSWLYAICLAFLTAYSAFIVFLPEPDHKVFVQAREIPEGKSCSSETVDSANDHTANEDLSLVLTPGKKKFAPLTKFLTVTKD